jgi:hypothetical protein
VQRVSTGISCDVRHIILGLTIIHALIHTGLRLFSALPLFQVMQVGNIRDGTTICTHDQRIIIITAWGCRRVGKVTPREQCRFTSVITSLSLARGSQTG